MTGNVHSTFPKKQIKYIYFWYQKLSFNFILNVCMGSKYKYHLNLNTHTYCIFIECAYSSAFYYSVDIYCNILKFYSNSVFISGYIAAHEEHGIYIFCHQYNCVIFSQCTWLLHLSKITIQIRC